MKFDTSAPPNTDNLIEETDLCMETSTLNPPEENSVGALETEENTSQKLGQWRGIYSRKPSKEDGLLIHQGIPIYKPERMEGSSTPQGHWRGIDSCKLLGGTDDPDHLKGLAELSNIEVLGASNQQGETDLDDKFCTWCASKPCLCDLLKLELKSSSLKNNLNSKTGEESIKEDTNKAIINNTELPAETPSSSNSSSSNSPPHSRQTNKRNDKTYKYGCRKFINYENKTEPSVAKEQNYMGGGHRTYLLDEWNKWGGDTAQH